MPILNNHLFFLSLSDRVFDICASKGLTWMKTKFFPPLLFYQINLAFLTVQVRHFTQKLFSHFPNRHPESELDSILTLNPGERHLIAIIYNKTLSLTPSPVDPVKQTWEQDLGIDICARHALIQCKVLH